MKILVCLYALFIGGFANTRIIGGQDARRNQFPHQVSLRFCLQGVCQHACGGAIINLRWIVTAAHCFTEAPALGSYQVLAGVTNLDEDSPQRQLVSIRLVYINPLYKGGLNPHDVAVAQLDPPLRYNAAVNRIALPPAGHEYDYYAVISGWGSTGTSMPNRLQFANVPMVPIIECRLVLDALLGPNRHPLDSNGNICTGPLTGGTATCSGDSGGPLYEPGREVLLGVVSWGLSPCGVVPGPSVYTRISAYVDWIRDHVDRAI